MNQDSNTKNLSLLIWFLAVAAIIKIAWVAIAYFYLPEDGISRESGRAKSALHYRYKLASDTALQEIKTPVSRPVAKVPSIKDIKLVGIYSGGADCVVTLLKKGKSHILAKGDDIDGFMLKGASDREAYFEKDDKRYTLKLFESKTKNNGGAGSIEPVAQSSEASPQEEDMAISTQGGVRQVPRSLLKSYTTDLSKAMKDIGLRPVRREGQKLGYKVRFIRRSSPISKLGLQRGDIIKAINGEDIVDFNGPMSILRNADTIEGLSITVIRKNEEKELEYEVK